MGQTDDKKILHYSIASNDGAACGSRVPRFELTPQPHLVTCLSCLKTMRGEQTDFTKLDKRATREQFDRAVIDVVVRIRAEARKRSLHGLSKGMQKSQADQIREFAEASIKTSVAFTELVARQLYGDRPPPPDPLAVKQGRFANTLSIEDRSRTHFRDGSWWFWSSDKQTRVGPFDTEDIAAEAMVHLDDRTKSQRVEREEED